MSQPVSCSLMKPYFQAHDNLRVTQVHVAQQQFKINLWTGILGECQINSYLLPSRLDGCSYRIFLKYILPDLLYDFPTSLQDRIWFQQDGMSLHFSYYTWEYLNCEFEGWWIDRGEPIARAPWSPDFPPPIDFFLWGYLKDFVYKTTHYLC